MGFGLGFAVLTYMSFAATAKWQFEALEWSTFWPTRPPKKNRQFNLAKSMFSLKFIDHLRMWSR